MDLITENVISYVKKCDVCGMHYRYQEKHHGIHNYNDTFFIGVDVCQFLRNGLQEHLPVGSVVKVLEHRLQTQLCSKTILNSYLHFEALNDHTYEFKCDLCGYYPSIMIMDLNRKVNFKHATTDMDTPKNYKEDEADYINCKEFWDDVENRIIRRGISANLKSIEEEFKPDLLSWAPFIGKQTRISPVILNTEHRKIKKDTGEMESDCRGVSEERLLELMQQSTFKDVACFVRKLGLKPHGSKLDMIMNIKKKLGNNNQQFKKHFTNVLGCSGGVMSATCPHGIIYALKFVLRAESPRDFVDVLLSMKHQPNIVIVDMANLVVAHGNNRAHSMFYPHSGMVAEPTVDNVNAAVDGNLKVSFDWLSCKPAEISFGQHPVTGSSQHYCLFDRLHEANCTKREEVLRRVTLVSQLNGKVNSQRVEQLNNIINKDARYLNQMQPLNHIFLFRCNTHIRNKRMNEKVVHKLQALSSLQVVYDNLGRATLDKNMKIPRPEAELQSQHRPSIPKLQKNEPAVIDLTNKTEQVIDAGNNIKDDNFWISELNLKNRDKRLAEDGYWLNDRIINAAMFLLQKEHPGVNGLKDVITAQRYGFEMNTEGQPFVQILNIRNNHWITLSNAKCLVGASKIYDSLISLSFDKEKERIRYPINVEQAACQFLKPNWNFIELQVADSQQQSGGSDCGLFSIAFAAAICAGLDPAELTFHQEMLRGALMQCLQEKSMTKFLESVIAENKCVPQPHLFEWNCKVYCHCRMPDDGKLMIHCAKCKNWFHEKCESGNFSANSWKCIKCDQKEKEKIYAKEEKKKQQEMMSKERGRVFRELRKAAMSDKDTKEVVSIFDAINTLALKNILPCGERAIGVVDIEEYRKITADFKDLCGVTYCDKKINEMFIVVFRKKHKNLKGLLFTIIHEMIHAVHSKENLGGSDHGKEFLTVGNKVLQSIKMVQRYFPKPYCDVKLEQKRILAAKEID